MTTTDVSRAVERATVAGLCALVLCSCHGAVDERSDEPVTGASDTPGVRFERTNAVGCELPAGERSFDQQKTDPSHLDGACVPTYSRVDLQAGFAMIRDRRPLSVIEQPDFPRRIPWLVVDNGCEERAVAAAFFLAGDGFATPYYARVQARPKKTLSLVTPNSPRGAVRWSSHVAPVVRVGDALMIMDPAIDPDGPLAIADWMARFSRAEDVDVALCRDFEKGAGCFAAAPVPPQSPQIPALPHTGGIYPRLTVEWRVQELLGRDPARVLGDCPPWVSCPTPEPAPDPGRAPSIRRLASDEFTDEVFAPIYVIGDNFVSGLTTVRVTGEGIDEIAPIAAINRLRVLLDVAYPPGTYEVTAANGDRVSNVATMIVQ